MKLSALLPAEYNMGVPIVTVDSIVPHIKDIELPISKAKPEVLYSAKGKPVTYLINYNPGASDSDNLQKTRHCLYVDKETYLRVKKMWDGWISSGLTNCPF